MSGFRSVLFVGALLFSGSALAQGCTQAEPQEATIQTREHWQLVWSDEFDGQAIDAEKWSHEIDCWGGGNDERQCYTDWPENSRVEDGCLVITARLDGAAGPAWPEQMRGQEGIDASEVKEQLFTSARIRTKNKAEWTYGRVEVRAKLPEGQGLWPAIWMLPTDEVYGQWALSGEIDIVEAVNLGEPCRSCRGGIENQIHGTIHYGGKWPENKYMGNDATLPNTDDGEQGFNVFAIEWTEDRIDWFLNGERYGRITSRRWSPLLGGRNGNKSAPFDQRFHLIMNLAVGGNFPESQNEGGVTLQGFPRDMLVDWVRVYQCPTDETGKACRS